VRWLRPFREPIRDDGRPHAATGTTGDTAIRQIGLGKGAADDRRQWRHELSGDRRYGAALTDASAWLIQHKLSTARRDSLLKELFERPRDNIYHPSGLELSFIRIDMAASDFALRQYSYDDMPPGQSDTGLVHFSIDPIARRRCRLSSARWPSIRGSRSLRHRGARPGG
jgi:hypothetical protein